MKKKVTATRKAATKATKKQIPPVEKSRVYFRRVVKWGSTRSLTLPGECCTALGWDIGTELAVVAMDGELRVKESNQLGLFEKGKKQ